MRILFATESYWPNVDGGAQAQRNLIGYLLKKGHEVAVVAPGLRNENYEEKFEGARIYRCKGRTIPFYQEYTFSPYPLPRVRKIVKEFAPDAINTNSPYQIGLSGLWTGNKRNIPVVGLNHTQPENMFLAVSKTSFLFNTLERAGWYWLVGMYNRCCHVVSPTKSGTDLLVEHGLRTPDSAISSGIDLSKFRPIPERKGDFREKYGIPDKKVILYSGRVSGEKRLDVLLAAFREARKVVDAHLVITGEGREMANIRRMARDMGIAGFMTFTGFVKWEDFHEIYNTADMFAISSEAELQSIVLLEAVATGLPAVATNKDAMPELVHDGKNGYLFSPGNHKEMAQKLVRILTDDELARKMGKKSLEIAKPHSLENVARDYEAVFRNAIGKYSCEHNVLNYFNKTDGKLTR